MKKKLQSTVRQMTQAESKLEQITAKAAMPGKSKYKDPDYAQNAIKEQEEKLKDKFEGDDLEKIEKAEWREGHAWGGPCVQRFQTIL